MILSWCYCCFVEGYFDHTTNKTLFYKHETQLILCAMCSPRQKYINELFEKIQDRACSFFSNNYSWLWSVARVNYCPGLQSLDTRRDVAFLVLFRKFSHSARTPLTRLLCSALSHIGFVIICTMLSFTDLLTLFTNVRFHVLWGYGIASRISYRTSF